MIIDCCVTEITDQRSNTNKVYSVEALMLLIFSAAISGYDSIEGIIGFGELKQEWLNKFVKLKALPSPETLRFFLCSINPNELTKCFAKFVEVNQLDFTGDCIGIDGKTMRGTQNKTSEAIHMISAWSHQHGITLAAMESKGKKNEIKTIPNVIDMLDAKNAVISTDAMGCQTAIAAKIIESGNDYMLQLKANQGKLFEQIQAYYHKLERENYAHTEYGFFEDINKGHGRIEVRKYAQFKLSDWVDDVKKWDQLNTAVRVERTRIIGDNQTEEVSWYISSLDVDAPLAAKSIRCHWGVETPLHWRLDVVFREDEYGLHSGNGPVNMAIIKRFCMNLLKKQKPTKRLKSLKSKVMACAIDDSYRETALFG